MALTVAARDRIAALLMGESGAAFAWNSTNAWVAVGSSTAAFTSTQSQLLSTGAASTSMDATYPQRATNVLTYRVTFGTGQANFPWEEWGIRNASATNAGELLNRKQEAMGTKLNSQSWQFTGALTIST
jgi:hypothetical protein